MQSIKHWHTVPLEHRHMFWILNISNAVFQLCAFHKGTQDSWHRKATPSYFFNITIIKGSVGWWCFRLASIAGKSSRKFDDLAIEMAIHRLGLGRFFQPALWKMMELDGVRQLRDDYESNPFIFMGQWEIDGPTIHHQPERWWRPLSTNWPVIWPVTPMAFRPKLRPD